tara:strand:- start:1275 stop:1535 length:261 start_codon:yes stop_codon:yes gene_type:complete
MTKKKWFVYIVECSDNTLYTGVTTDIPRRVLEHNEGSRGAKYTRSRRPVSLVYWEECEDRSSAQKAESYFKKLTKQKKVQLIYEGR